MARTGMFATLVCLALAATAEAQMMMAPPTTGTSTGRTGIFGRRGRNVQPATSYYAAPGMTMGTYGTIQPTAGTTYGTGTVVYGTGSTGSVVYGSGTPGTIIGSGTPGSVVYGGTIPGSIVYGGTPGSIVGGGTIPGSIVYGGSTVTPGTVVYGGTPGSIVFGGSGTPMTTTPGIYSTPVAGTYNPAMAGTTMTQPGYNTYRNRLLGRRGGSTTPYAMGTTPGTYVYPR